MSGEDPENNLENNPEHNSEHNSEHTSNQYEDQPHREEEDQTQTVDAIDRSKTSNTPNETLPKSPDQTPSKREKTRSIKYFKRKFKFTQIEWEVTPTSIEEDRRVKICIVNNYPLGFYTNRVSRLEELIERQSEKFEVLVMHFTEMDYDELCQCDGVIYTGSSYNVSHFQYKFNLAREFEPVLSYIRGTRSKPMLGICYGFHLLGRAFDANVKRMNIPSPGNQIIKFDLKEEDELIPYENISVNVFHRDYIEPDDPVLETNFEIIATHDYRGYSTVQYMKHKRRPFYAIQFHPETHPVSYGYEGTYDMEDIHKTRIIGEQIVGNFLDICLRFKSPEN